MVQRFTNPDGPTISTATGRVVEIDGRWFRDLAGTGELIPAGDWRLDATARARDLAGRLSLEQIAGLMLYSRHQTVPSLPGGPFSSTYGGQPYDPDVHAPDDLTDGQRELILRDNIRHVLVITFADVPTAVGWHNRMQQLAEEQPFSVPVNFSTDPRHGASDSGAEFKSSGAAVSKWPEGIGLAAIGDVETVRRFADTVRQEYRALGFTTALGPQIDLATEPRWMRAVDTFGGDVEQAVAFTRAYVDALQTTPDAEGGWGPGSVIAMVKHWPGGGTGEGGRDAHYRFGQYNVYPGGNADAHRRPFVEGAFALDGPTGSAGAVMPYYSVSVGQNEGAFGNAYSEQLIKDELRGELGYDGVVCTDWGITGDPGPMDSFAARCFGVEDLSVAERHLRLIMNGVDQFGGNNEVAPVLEAYALGAEWYGEDVMRARFEEAAVRLLRGMFRVGLFDDPYLELAESLAVVGNPAFVQAGHDAQLASVIALKGLDTRLPRGAKVWIPPRHTDAHKGFMRNLVPAADSDALQPAVVAEYFEAVDDPADADAALVVMESPHADPYVDGFRPISLQYRPYRAETAREASLAGDRSYRGADAVISNASDLDRLEQARAAMGDRPVVAVVKLDTPVVLAEVEPLADALFVHYGVSDRALLDVVTGAGHPGGRLPATMPADMATVEASCEDVFDDYEPYVDAAGNAYATGFGLGAPHLAAD
ncbi:glycoside hydrolase family 3 N-terminal domain-containing protein [Propioniciclava soli]|uniref:beta-glucosidase n=1 Tax=Propioniciclava soli TaxID=2775081 RepID=A0ABZ3C7G6_9ACTN|nr:glycoside hydrolase family 3 N-terminal domain-containing protein [Propioniciclava soli]